MTSDAGLSRRVSRLENETESIYELITEIRATQDEHTQRFESIDGRFGGMESRFDGVDGRLNGLDGRLDSVNGRLGRIESTLSEVVRRLPEPR